MNAQNVLKKNLPQAPTAAIVLAILISVSGPLLLPFLFLFLFFSFGVSVKKKVFVP